MMAYNENIQQVINNNVAGGSLTDSTKNAVNQEIEGDVSVQRIDTNDLGNGVPEVSDVVHYFNTFDNFDDLPSQETEDVLQALAQAQIIDLGGDGARLDLDGVNSGVGQRVIAGSGGDDFVMTGDTRSTVEAGVGNDTVIAGAGNDSIYGGQGDDSLFGGQGDDFVRLDSANNGNDTIDSGSGFDVLGIDSARSNFEFSLQGSSSANGLRSADEFTPTADGGSNIVMTHKTTGETVIVKNSEYMQFSDGVIINAKSQEQADVARMYQIFDKAGDAEGMKHWWTDLENGDSLKDVAKNFLLQNQQYSEANMSNEDYIKALYSKVAKKSESEIDAEGMQYWMNALENGTESREDLLANFAMASSDVDYYDYINIIDGLV